MSPRLGFALFILLVSIVSVQAVVIDHSTHIFAVTNEGQGLEATLHLRIEPGTGKIFSGVDALVGTSTQEAYKVAVALAKNYVSTTNQYNYYFSIDSTASIVDGPSAGAATALLVVTMLENKRIPPNVAMTGTISDKGQVGVVGGVFEKAKAASAGGIKLFLIPKGEARQVTRTDSGIQSINLVEYAPQQWGMKVVEVNTLDEAIQLAFSDIGSIDINKQIQESRSLFVPQPISYHPQLEPLHAITEKYLKKAGDELKAAKAELNTTILTNTELVSVMFESLTESEQVLEEAQNLYDQNFLYSAANFAFTARVNALLVEDIAQNPSILNDTSPVFEAKVQQLKKNLETLKATLDSGALPDQVDWQIAAQQRWLWAYNAIQKLANTQTIVIQTGNPSASSNVAGIDRLRDFEFAIAWKDVAEDFSMPLQNASRQTALSPALADYASQQLIQAENKIASVQDDQRVDIQRRLDGAKTAQTMKWPLSESVDAASVSFLADAEQQIPGKDLAALQQILDQKIADLDQKLKTNQPFVWARTYLDHAKYYQQAVRHYQEQNRASQALDAAQSGVSVAFLAESAFESHQKIYSLLENMPSQPFEPSKSPVPLSLPSSISSTNPFFWTTLAAALVLLLLVALLANMRIQQKKHEQSGASILPNKQFHSFLRQSAELDKQWALGTISKEAYLKKREQLVETTEHPATQNRLLPVVEKNSVPLTSKTRPSRALEDLASEIKKQKNAKQKQNKAKKVRS